MPEVVEPGVHVLQRLRIHRVQPPGALRPYGCEPVVAQDLQVLRHGWLGDPELLPDCGGDRAGGALTVREQFENSPPYRITQDVERVHG